MAIDTAKATDRRILRLNSIDEALGEVDRLVSAERAGRLNRVGNWTLGQAMGHLAVWAEYSFTGAPLKVPFFIRWLMRPRKKRFLYGPMPPGVRIPRVEDGTLGTAPMPLDDAAERWRRAIERLRREPPTTPNVIYGPLTQDEWIAVNLRHAELHLGFFAEGKG